MNVETPKPSPRTLPRTLPRSIAAAALALLPLLLLGQPVAGGPSSLPAAPQSLEETGLYADFAGKVVRAENLPYSPQYPLYTDGAVKRRWLYLPPGSHIDAADIDHWVFPVGTRIWKEFAFGRPLETRFMERQVGGSWLYATYAWNAEGTEAKLAPERGIAGVAVAEGSVKGQKHDIPGRYDCLSCHQGQPQEVLGIGALQLSPRRDAGALHAEAMPEGGVDLAALVERGLIANLPADLAPPEIPGAPRERAVLGYLHGNCGHCHNAVGPLRGLKLDLTVVLARPEGQPPAALAALNGVRSMKKPRSAPAASRVVAGAPEKSGLIERLRSQDPNAKMPTLGNRLIDEQALALLEAWIRDDLKAPPGPDDPNKDPAGKAP